MTEQLTHCTARFTAEDVRHIAALSLRIDADDERQDEICSYGRRVRIKHAGQSATVVLDVEDYTNPMRIVLRAGYTLQLMPAASPRSEHRFRPDPPRGVLMQPNSLEGHGRCSGQKRTWSTSFDGE